jgi:hypothetical protein
MGVMERRRMPRTVRALLIGAAVVLPAAAVIGPAGPASAQVSASVTVDATASLGTVPAHAIGCSRLVTSSLRAARSVRARCSS